MNEERLLILRMVAEGKISPEEAERLIAALDQADRTSENAHADEAPDFADFFEHCWHGAKGVPPFDKHTFKFVFHHGLDEAFDAFEQAFSSGGPRGWGGFHKRRKQ